MKPTTATRERARPPRWPAWEAQGATHADSSANPPHISPLTLRMINRWISQRQPGHGGIQPVTAEIRSFA
jgi:hypothetical protein